MSQIASSPAIPASSDTNAQEDAPAVTPNEGRRKKALIQASREYASEDVGISTRVTITTMLLLAVSWPAHFLLPLWAQPITGVLLGLLIVRGFVLFHDYQHGALLRGKGWAEKVYAVFGLLVLTPPIVWRDTHNYHHAHNAKLIGSHIGSFPTLSVSIYKKLGEKDQRSYRLSRHPLVILFAYLTVFLLGMCVSPLRRNFKRNRSAIAALVIHFALAGLAFWWGGPRALLLGFLLPLNVAFITGAYLFYAQHNFEGVVLRGRQHWEYTEAALGSSSYMPMNPLMEWFTASIGFHHIHHLNSRIPFYRLEEAMEGIPELQNPTITRLRVRDIAACLRLKLWDADRGRMIHFDEIEDPA